MSLAHDERSELVNALVRKRPATMALVGGIIAIVFIPAMAAKMDRNALGVQKESSQYV